MPEITWNSGAFFDRVEGNLAQNMRKAGFYFQGKLRSNLNQSQQYKRYVGQRGITYKGLAPSLPGNFPKKLTGQLIKSIAQVFDAQAMTLTVGSGLNYASFLETSTRFMQARPWLSRTYEIEKDNLARIILGGQ